MSLVELLPDVRALPRPEKIQLLRLLTDELCTERSDLIDSNQSYDVWSPSESFSAAKTLLEALAVDCGEK